jgi:hypothetical protein
VITFAVVVFDVLRRDAVVRQGQRGGVHESLGRDLKKRKFEKSRMDFVFKGTGVTRQQSGL